MRVTVDNLGKIGMVKDVSPPETPPEAFTYLANIRTGPYGAEVFLGHERTLNTGTTAWTQAPLWLTYIPVAGSTGYWVGLGTTAVYARQAGGGFTETNISRAVGGAYSATADKKWQGFPFGGLGIFNNGVDVPQLWSPVSGATTLVALTNWPATYKCRVIRPFGRFLVAADITKGVTRYPQLIKWGHPADPGAVPVSWDETLPQYDAGEFPLNDTETPIQDLLILRSNMIVYAQDQVWSMRYVQGGDIFGFDPLFHEQGALTTGAVAGFKKDTEYHAVLGGDDIYVHNGQNPQSIVTPAMRRWFFQQIDPTNYQRAFVVTNPVYSEVWFCIPQIGETQPTLALVWNWETNSIGFRELLINSSNGDIRSTASTRGTPCIALGYLEDTGVESWASDPNTWSSDTSQWSSRSTSPVVPRLIMADQSAGKRSYLMDSSYTFDGNAIFWQMERQSISLGRQDREGRPKTDTTTDKLVTEIWMGVEATESFSIQLGSQDAPDQNVTWGDTGTYTPGSTEFLATYISGRIISIKFTGSHSTRTRLMSYGLEVGSTGTYN